MKTLTLVEPGNLVASESPDPGPPPAGGELVWIAPRAGG